MTQLDTAIQNRKDEIFQRIKMTGQINDQDWNFIKWHFENFQIPMFTRLKREKELKKLKEKKIERTAFSIKDIDYKRNISYNFFNNRIFENRNMEISSILMLKMGENILKLRK